MKDCALKLEFIAQFGRIDQISVVRKRKITLDMPDYKRLNIVCGDCGEQFIEEI